MPRQAIERFNHILDEAANFPPSWQQRIVCFLYEKSGLLIGDRLVRIDLPQKTCLHIDFPHPSPENSRTKKNYSTHANDTIAGAVEKVSHLRELVIPTVQVQRQTLELYFMKIINLLETNKLFSKLEARSLVLKTPTHITLDNEAQQLTISQQLTPLPGQLVEVSATFQKDKRTLNFSIFQSDNISTQSIQTGFPHPLQHHGWALPEILIPKHLHRPGRLQHFPSLYLCKKQIAQALLPHGSLVEKARSFLRKKREVFEEHRKEFLSYHKNLALAIAENSTYLDDVKRQHIIFFFDALVDHTAPYDVLSTTHHQMMQMITLSYNQLEKAWLRGEINDLEAAQKLLNNEMMNSQINWLNQIDQVNNEVEKASLYYCHAMGHVLSLPAQQLIMQQNSEIMENAPPVLSLFAKKIQTALYLQLWEFNHELSLDPKDTDLFLSIKSSFRR